MFLFFILFYNLPLQMELWFDTLDATGEKFDRCVMLKASLFDIFADHDRTPPVVDYISMVSNHRSSVSILK